MSRLQQTFLALLVATSACGSDSSSHPDGGAEPIDASVPPPHEPRLAVQHTGRIFVVAWHDGQPGDPVQATELFGFDASFRWSPRGAWLMTHAQGKVQLIDASGESPAVPLQVDPGGQGRGVRYANFAPSGTRVLLETAGAAIDDHALAVADILPDGTLSPTRTVLRAGDQDLVAYDWAPDSTHIALTLSGGSSGGALWVADTESRVPKDALLVTSRAFTDTGGPPPAHWCGDSQRLFFLGRSGIDTTAPVQLWSRTLRDDRLDEPLRINQPIPAEDFGVFAWTQAPDCRAITYTAASLAVVDTRDGGAAVPRLGVNAPREVIWSSDSHWLAIAHSDSQLNANVAEVYDMSSGVPTGGTKLDDGARVDGLVFRADGRQLIYSSDQAPSYKRIVDLGAEGAIGPPTSLPLATGLESTTLAVGSPWSSDATRLLYGGTPPDHNSTHAVVIDLTTAPPKVLQDLGPIGSVGVGTALHDRNSPWAPGANLLVYLADRSDLFDQRLRVLDADHPDAEPTTILTGAIDDWAWAP